MSSGQRKLRLCGLGLGLLVWTVAGLWLGPRIVRRAYSSNWVPWLNALADGRSATPAAYLVRLWYGVIGASLLSAFVWVARSICRARGGDCAARFFARCVGYGTAESLGAIRILTFSILLTNVVWEDLPSIADLPAELRPGGPKAGVMQLVHLSPQLEAMYSSREALVVLKIATCGSLLLAAAGVLTRISVPVAALLALAHGGVLREYTHLFHTCLAPIHLAFALSFLPCGDGLSVDCRYLGFKLGRAGAIGYGWSRYLCWIVVAAAYGAAGLSKLANGGYDWWHGDNLRFYVLTDLLSQRQFEWGLDGWFMGLPVAVYSAAGATALLTELLYPLVLFSRKARVVIPLLTVAMHLGILLAQGILFFDLILLQLIFFDWRKAPARVLGAMPATTAADVVGETAAVLAQHRHWSYACLALGVFFFVSWERSIERYPLSAWQMFSNNFRNEPNIVYYKAQAQYADGTIDEIRLDTLVGAVADSRYHDIYRHGERPTRLLLRSALAAARRRVSPGRPAPTALEVQRWRWNHREHQHDGRFGEVESSWLERAETHEISETPPGRVAGH